MGKGDAVMQTKTKFMMLLVTALVAIVVILPAAPQVHATSDVNMRFAVTGLTTYNSNIITIDGTIYTVSDLGWRVFTWAPGSTHTIVASTPVTGYDGNLFRFSSWTNGDGLSGASGTFTTPATGITVTANYEMTTVKVSFATTGLSNMNNDVVLTIDGTPYAYWALPSTSFLWESGSTHTLVAAASIIGWDSITHHFSSWTNGNGLTGLSGTFTTSTSATTLTVNYVNTATIVNFAANGLANINDDVILTVDGVALKYYELSWRSFIWATGSTHTIVASTPITGYDGNMFRFSNWTNGNGLISSSGTFTTPASSTTVTVNYVKTTVQVNLATTGLTNMNNDVVLTIDGTPYTFWNVATTSFLWEKGSTHTVAASTPLPGWDSVTHQFSSWNNGNGLTGTSGTFTTPTSDVTLTANYALSSSSAAATSLTISCNPSSVDKTGAETATITGILASSGSGVSGKTIALSYFDGADWIPIVTVTTLADGSYSYGWDVPTELANGYYAVKADFSSARSYVASSATTGSDGNGGHLFVLPEYLWGGLAAMLACFAALVLFKTRGNLHLKHR